MKYSYLIILIFLAGIALPCSALLVPQMGKAYLGETVDISQVIAWPDYKLAWCKGDRYGCEPPDQIIQIEGHQHDYFLDPAVWHTGTYYRWSGSWNRGENMVAFTILPGTRPAPTVAPTQTPTANQTVVPNVTIEGPYHYIIARGDDPLITVRTAREDNAHLWMFGATSQVLDYPMVKKGFDYSYQMKTTDTFSQGTGKYSGYLQFDGKNGMQDVKWDNATKCLSTPYRTSLQKDICPNVWNPANVKMEFENLIKTGYNSDDVLIPVTMDVKEPEIVITELSLGETKIWIQGKTTWSSGTTLTFKLDPDNYKLAQEIRLHTWNTTIQGNLTDYRTFTITCPLEPEELYIGVHTLKMSVTKNKFTTDAFYNFRRTDTYVMPTPTPKVVAILTDMNGTRITATPKPVYAPVMTTATTEPIPIQTTATPTANVTTVKTTTTPKPTTVKPTPTPTKDQNIVVPLPVWIPIVAVGLGLLWRKK